MSTEYFMKWSELDVVTKILVAMMVVAIVGLSVFFSGYWMTGLIVVWFACCVNIITAIAVGIR